MWSFFVARYNYISTCKYYRSHYTIIMQSRAVVFCCGAAAGLVGAVGLYKARPQLFQQQAVDDHQDRDANNDLFM